MGRMTTRLCALASLLALTFAVGCGSSSDGAKCVPGLTIECPCPGGQNGSQTCTLAGMFAACVCAGQAVDSGAGITADGGAAVLDMAVDQPVAASISDARTGTSEVQPDTALVVLDAELGTQPDTAMAVPDAQLGDQPERPASVAILTVDKSSVEFVSKVADLDGGSSVDVGGAVSRPIKFGSVGVATVVVTNNGKGASGALAIVAGPNVSTSGCTGALAPGATCSLSIVAAPTALGQFSSTLSIWATPGAVTPILITVSATVVPPPSITSFVASPTVVNSGESAILAAVFSGGTGIVDQGIGSVASGSETNTGPISTPTTYTLTVTNAFGDSTRAQATVYAGVSGEPCVPAKTIAGSGSGNSGSFGTTGAFCFRTADTITGWNCSNFTGRTLKVNGTVETCGALPLPAKFNGYYYFEASAGGVDYASIYWYASSLDSLDSGVD